MSEPNEHRSRRVAAAAPCGARSLQIGETGVAGRRARKPNDADLRMPVMSSKIAGAEDPVSERKTGAAPLDRRTAACVAVAWLVLINKPLYPLTVWLLIGAEAATRSLAALAIAPLYAAVLWLAPRSGYGARVALPLVGLADTAIAAKAFGSGSGAELYLIACGALAVVSFSAREALTSRALVIAGLRRLRPPSSRTRRASRGVASGGPRPLFRSQRLQRRVARRLRGLALRDGGENSGATGGAVSSGSASKGPRKRRAGSSAPCAIQSRRTSRARPRPAKPKRSMPPPVDCGNRASAATRSRASMRRFG